MMKFVLPLLILAVLVAEFKLDLGEKTVDDRVSQYGASVQERLAPLFAAKGVPYPPSKVTLIGLKEELILELHAAGKNGQYRLIQSYPILAASGRTGPKLREGDLQVPEGLYRIESLNPNSRFHLSLRINYPNEADRFQAKVEGRENLGGDIMIHGNAVSIGCIAVGDTAAEELFVLAARTGLQNIQVILSPVDFRVRQLPSPLPGEPQWIGDLYAKIKAELGRYGTKKEPEPSSVTPRP